MSHIMNFSGDVGHVTKLSLMFTIACGLVAAGQGQD